MKNTENTVILEKPACEKLKKIIEEKITKLQVSHLNAYLDTDDYLISIHLDTQNNTDLSVWFRRYELIRLSDEMCEEIINNNIYMDTFFTQMMRILDIIKNIEETAIKTGIESFAKKLVNKIYGNK